MSPGRLDTVLDVENLGKRYSISHRGASGDGLRHAIEAAVRSPMQWLRTRVRQSSRKEDFWALRGVCFQVQRGEVVGIIGRNGAGKSTLLKILSRITPPTEGRARVQGRIASLLEVGTGFHQELTGRENIFLNGSILGMTRADIIRRFDEIVTFSEIEDFLDTPVKRYSSGMYVRLAFAVAAHLEPEILIIDEVLAVGDAAFQKKCLGKMESFAQSGRTVLFVSHNMEAVSSLCGRVIWMQDGQVHLDGPADQVVGAYFKSLEATYSYVNDQYGFAVRQVNLKNSKGEPCSTLRPGDDLAVEIVFEAKRPVAKPYLAICIYGAAGPCFASNMVLDGLRPAVLEGTGKIVCTFKSIPLLPQDYTVTLGIRAAEYDEVIVPYQRVGLFNVIADLAEYGYRGDYIKWARQLTPVIVPYEWQFPDGTSMSVSLNRPLESQTDIELPAIAVQK
jgi:lipopolysaccharide transport system ATP-binding protein